MEIEKLIERITEDVYKKIIEEIRSAESSSSFSRYANGVDVASYIDHSLLKPDATSEQIRKLCQEAKEYRFATVCIMPWYVPFAAEQLRGSGIKVCTVVAFPYGAASTRGKVAEVKEAVENGADEVDVYINTSALKNGDFEAFKSDLESVTLAAKGKAKVKVVIESSLLTEEEKVKTCTIAKAVGADFIKISTFLGTGKASVSEVEFFKRILGTTLGIKVDGGVKDFETAMSLINAGATRIGASASVAIAAGNKSVMSK